MSKFPNIKVIENFYSKGFEGDLTNAWEYCCKYLPPAWVDEIEVGFSVIEELFPEENIVFVQIKEKFETLRLYKIYPKTFTEKQRSLLDRITLQIEQNCGSY